MQKHLSFHDSVENMALSLALLLLKSLFLQRITWPPVQQTPSANASILAPTNSIPDQKSI